MHLSAPEEFGLRCMLQLARGPQGAALTIDEIAEREGISVANVGKLMGILRRAELVRSVRGRQGGYRLARGADQTSVAAVLEAMGGGLFQPRFCERFRGEGAACVHTSDCAIRSVWSTLDRVVRGVLDRTMLTDLTCSEQSMAVWLKERTAAPVVWVGMPSSASS